MSSTQTPVPVPRIIRSSEEGESSTEFSVPLQKQYTGDGRAIPNSLANIACTTLGGYGLLQWLNSILETSHTISISSPGDSTMNPLIVDDTEDQSDWIDDDDDPEQPFDAPFDVSPYADPLAALIDSFIQRRMDFGLAYAYVRPWWNSLSDPDHRVAVDKQMFLCESDDTSMRDMSLSQWSHQTAPTIHPPSVPPRRVWDLYANRVVPIHVVSAVGGRGQHPNGDFSPKIVGISHSWAREEERKEVNSPINSYEWPIPIPADTSLDRVRVELLNLGLEYVWLDVLCLRQASPQGPNSTSEILRKEEWKVDVPTIGNVYRDAERVVHYYSGLGRPFEIGDLRSERHWLNRAWTLQEISPHSIVAGITSKSPTIPSFDSSWHSLKDQTLDKDTREFFSKLSALSTFSRRAEHIFPVLEAMRHRAATNELDKICGLSYLLHSSRLPPYIVEASVEHAWSRFLETIDASYCGDLLFLFPEQGGTEARWKWAPSWTQVKDARTLPSCEELELAENMRYDSSYHIYRHSGPHLPEVRIEGLGDATGADVTDRVGAITLTEGADLEHRFTVFAAHTHPIPDGQYILHGSRNCQFWVVGKVGPVVKETGERGAIEKVSVLRMTTTVAQELMASTAVNSVECGFI